MHTLISNSCFPADAILALTDLPVEFGVEIQVEFGTDYYWNTVLPRVMKHRSGPLAIHGPFVDIDLSAKDLDETALLEYHKWAFDVYNRHGASHFAVHPDGKINAPTPPAEIAQMRTRALDRIAKLVDGRVYTTGTFGANKAVLVCAEPQYIDLAIGADFGVGYLELKDFNHSFRILETAALRIKEPNAIVNFE